MNQQELHRFITDALQSGGRRWDDLRIFSDKVRETPRYAKVRTMQNRFGGIVKPDDVKTFEDELVSLYDTVFCDDRLSNAMEKDRDFSASFHFGPKDDETCVTFSRNRDFQNPSPLWFHISYHCISSTFEAKDADGNLYPDENRYETLEDTGIV